MQRKIRTFLSGILLIVLLGVLCACQPESTSSSSESTELPQLKIGVDVLEPFYSIDENGNATGIDAEIALEACRRAGYEPVFVLIPWNDKETYLNDGSVDCLWNAFAEDGRESQYTWTIPYMESDLRVIADVRAPDHTLEDLRHSAGIALRAGSKMEEIFMNEPEQAITLYACSTYDAAKTAFIKGYVSALGGHELSLRKVIQEYPGLYRFLDGSLMTIHLGAAFCKTSPASAFQPLNDALSEMKEDGTIDSIVSRYKAALSEDGEVQLDEKN